VSPIANQIPLCSRMAKMSHVWPRGALANQASRNWAWKAPNVPPVQV
jgi:hypothetical protein